MIGIHLVDISKTNPGTGLYELAPELLEGKIYVPNSRKWFFPLKFSMGRESQKIYQDVFFEILKIFFCVSEINQTELP